MIFPNGEFFMGLSIPVKSHKPPKAAPTRERGGKPQTTYSKRMVRNCVARLESCYGKYNLAFVTYTLPNLEESEMNVITENWGEVTRQLKQSIERDLAAAGIVPEVVYVSEIQEQRYWKTGVIAPHIHAVFQSRKNRYSPYVISTERNSLIWDRILSNVLGRAVEAPHGARIEKIKKSAERYMAKYMSKGSSMASHICNNGLKEHLPKSWWGATLSLRNWVKEHTRVFSDATKNHFRSNYKFYQRNIRDSPFSWLYVHLIESVQPEGEVIEIPIMLMGRMKPEWFDRFTYKELEAQPMSWEP
jgi:hypothetical protein